MHKSFVEPTVLTQIKTLVGSIHHYCVFIQAGLFQIIKNSSNTFINRFDTSQIIVHIASIFPQNQFTTSEFSTIKIFYNWLIISIPCFSLIWSIATSTMLVRPICCIGVLKHFQIPIQFHCVFNRHILLMFSQSPTAVIIKKCFRQWKNHIFKCVQVFRIWFPGAMWCFVMHHQHKWFAWFFSRFKKLQCFFGDYITNISSNLIFPCWITKFGVVILSLSTQNIPVIETRWCTSQVPFSNNSSLITTFL